MKIAKYIKMSKIRGAICYDINAACMQSPKVDTLKSAKTEFWICFWF